MPEPQILSEKKYSTTKYQPPAAFTTKTYSNGPKMAQCELAARPLFQSLRQTYRRGLPVAQLQSNRSFASTPASENAAQSEAQRPAFYKSPDPSLVTSPRLERKLVRSGNAPIGSRRRRAALQNSTNIPFEQLPYQCFQEARKVLMEDREEKIKDIEAEREKIAKLRALETTDAEGEARKQVRLRSLEKQLEKLKIFADINDPSVKRRFEDGNGTNLYVAISVTLLETNTCMI